MNVIKKYWDSVYIYVLLLVTGLCICAGIVWTVFKLCGLYPNLSWTKILMFDTSQIIYLMIALYFIYRNRKDPSYIPERLVYVKGFIITVLLIQYNVILFLFPSIHVWEDTFLFLTLIAFLFDSKLMFANIVAYAVSLSVAHILRPERFLPIGEPDFAEVLVYRILMYVLTSSCIMFVVYFAERFFVQVKEDSEENSLLMEKQLQYYKNMELMDKELRKFRHDINNHFISIESYLNNGKIEELHNYFHDLEHSFSVQKQMYFSGNEIIDAILNHDLEHNCRNDVTITVYGSLPEIKTVSAMDLCTLFSNLLSNAVKSANLCADISASELTIRFAGGSKYFSIEIANSIPVERGVREREKRGRNHGYGIRKMKTVLEKYDGSYELNMEQQMLIITIYLPV